MTRRVFDVVRLTLAVLSIATAAAAQTTSTASQGPPPSVDSAHSVAAAGAASESSSPEADVPFSVAERTTYDVKFGFVHVGSGSMEVANVQTLRGHDAWHILFEIKGGTIFYHVNDTLESWFDVRTMSSLRFVQRLDEGGRLRNRNYEIFPDRQVFILNQKPEQPSVPEPLDDGSFLYFVRTLPLTVGDTYTFNRYFNPKANPVTIRVLRKERIRVPAGTFNAIVVQPIIKTSGIFGDRGQAQVWFSDDSARIMLQMKSKASIGSLDLYLKSYTPGKGAAASAPSGAAPDAPPPAPAAAPTTADSAPDTGAPRRAGAPPPSHP